MAEFTPKDPSTQDRTPRTYGTEPPRPVDMMEMPEGTIVIPEGNYLQPKRETFLNSVVTMMLTSLILFWMPLVNGLLAGTFGGFKTRRWSEALGAALVTSLAAPALIRFAYGFDEPDLERLFYGMGFTNWFLLHLVGTFLGAAFGKASNLPTAERIPLTHPRPTQGTP